jgi:hypothetical protein
MKRTALNFSHELRKSIPPHVIREDCDSARRHYSVYFYESRRSFFPLDIPAVKSIRSYNQLERLTREWKRYRTRCKKFYDTPLRRPNIFSRAGNSSWRKIHRKQLPR